MCPIFGGKASIHILLCYIDNIQGPVFAKWMRVYDMEDHGTRMLAEKKRKKNERCHATPPSFTAVLPSPPYLLDRGCCVLLWSFLLAGP